MTSGMTTETSERSLGYRNVLVFVPRFQVEVGDLNVVRVGPGVPGYRYQGRNSGYPAPPSRSHVQAGVKLEAGVERQSGQLPGFSQVGFCQGPFYWLKLGYNFGNEVVNFLLGVSVLGQALLCCRVSQMR